MWLGIYPGFHLSCTPVAPGCTGVGAKVREGRTALNFFHQSLSRSFHTGVTFSSSPLMPPKDPFKFYSIENRLLAILMFSNTEYSNKELSSPRAESTRAVTGRRNSHRWEGGRLFEPSAGFFYGNSCNSKSESRKMVSKVGN